MGHSEVATVRCEAPRKIKHLIFISRALSKHEHGLLHPRYFQNTPLEQSYSVMCFEKKFTATTRDKQAELPTYIFLIEFFNFIADIDNGPIVPDKCFGIQKECSRSEKLKNNA